MFGFLHCLAKTHRSYYYDTETGWYYFQSRYYDPVIHRFINADSLASTGQGALGYNMFAYCNNNPVVFYDFKGNLPFVNTMITDSAYCPIIPTDIVPIVTYDCSDSQYEYTTHMKENILQANYDGFVQGITVSKDGAIYTVDDNTRTNDAVGGIVATSVATTGLGLAIGKCAAIGGATGGLPGALIGFAVGCIGGIIYEAIDNNTSPNLSDGTYQNYKVVVHSAGYVGGDVTHIYHCYT